MNHSNWEFCKEKARLVDVQSALSGKDTLTEYKVKERTIWQIVVSVIYFSYLQLFIQIYTYKLHISGS